MTENRRSEVQRRYRTRRKIVNAGLPVPPDLKPANRGNQVQRMNTQKLAVYKHLCRYGKLTPLKALEKFGSFRLAARIRDLRDEGINIQTVIVERDGKRFAEYRLAA
jgi:hypothetical protein